MDGALGAVDTCAEGIIRDLMGSHLVLHITTFAIWVNTGHLVPVHDLEEGLAGASGHASGDTILRNAIDPDYMVGHFNTPALSRWAHGVSAEHTWHLTYSMQ